MAVAVLTMGAGGVAGAVEKPNSINTVAPSKAQFKTVKIKNSFIVLNQKEKKNRTTIVTKAVTPKSVGLKVRKGELVVQNVFDYADFTVLTKKQAKGLKVGNIINVTYNQDHIEKVVKNKFNVENKVIGQKWNKKTDAFVYEVEGKRNGYVFSNPISDYSHGNNGMILDVKEYGYLKKGDYIIVTFTHGSSDDIKSVKKIK